jgi:hypothetical protein
VRTSIGSPDWRERSVGRPITVRITTFSKKLYLAESRYLAWMNIRREEDYLTDIERPG